MTAPYKILGAVLINLALLDSARAMRNLAYDYPERELASDQVVFIGRDDPLFAKLNRSVPPAEFLVITRERLREAGDHAAEQRVLADQTRVKRIIRDEVAAIDAAVSEELHAAGVRVEHLPTRDERSEVPTRFIGWLGHYRFTRAWSYWVVQGETIRAMALEMYEHPLGRQFVRTAGYAGNTSPLDFETVRLYHVDTPEALAYFASVARAYQVCDQSLRGLPSR